MTGNDILRAIGSAEEKDLALSESISAKAKKKNSNIWWLSAAAAIILAAGIFSAVHIMGKKPDPGQQSVYVPTVFPTQNIPAETVPAETLPAETDPVKETEAVASPAVTPAFTPVPTSGPTPAPTPMPTPTPTAIPTVTPTTQPTTPPVQPTPTPTVPVPTDAPIFYEFASEEELQNVIRNGVDFFGDIHYYYKPKHVPSGYSLTSITVGNSGIEFNYSNGEKGCSFLWFWNVDPDELIATYQHAPHLEHHGKYYRFYGDAAENPSYYGVVWKQDGAAFYASVPLDYDWDDIEYFCDAKLIRMD